MDRRGRPEWGYKDRAIQEAAEQLRGSLNPEFIRRATFIPVPPSKERQHILYDDRMTQVLQRLGAEADVRELVYQRESMEDAHSADIRPGPNDLYANYALDETLTEGEVTQIAIVDDVLTTGCHFKAMQQILSENYPQAPIVGLFIARRVPNTPPA
jgi:predicted amidophosphoribosyltransferase